jgi:tetratricopeptide (TPR) repeat protein
MSPPLGSRGLLRRLAIQSQNCEGALAGRHSKTVAFVAFLALTTFGALATASAQPADINAINKAFQDHYARGNYPAAQIDAQELERLVKARFGADHAYYAVALRKLGIVFQAQGKLGEAEELLKRALAISEQALGNSHPDVAQALHNLAMVYGRQGKYGDAEELNKRALAIREKALGFRKIGEQHREPQPQHDLEFECEVLSSSHQIADQYDGRQDGDDLEHEHDRILDQNPRIELPEGRADGRNHDLGIEQCRDRHLFAQL